jgi:4-carboxymuconolactone decarboxylase
MTRIVCMVVALAVTHASCAGAQDVGGLVVTTAATRTTSVAPAATFTGTARVESLFDTTATTRAYGASVAFEPGARTAWHSHARAQVLIVTAGVGLVQRWGGPVQEIRTGDVVRIPPETKHWHGAAPTTAMTHLGIVERSGDKTTTWLEKVSDAQYNARPVNRLE